MNNKSNNNAFLKFLPIVVYIFCLISSIVMAAGIIYKPNLSGANVGFYSYVYNELVTDKTLNAIGITSIIFFSLSILFALITIAIRLINKTNQEKYYQLILDIILINIFNIFLLVCGLVEAPNHYWSVLSDDGTNFHVILLSTGKGQIAALVLGVVSSIGTFGYNLYRINKR